MCLTHLTNPAALHCDRELPPPTWLQIAFNLHFMQFMPDFPFPCYALPAGPLMEVAVEFTPLPMSVVAVIVTVIVAVSING